MGFKFKLQKLLEYKETLEGLKKTEYGNAVHELSLEEEKLFDIKEKRSSIIQLKDGKNTITNVGNIKMYSDYIRGLNDKIEIQNEVVRKVELKMEKAQEELLEAMQEKKSFEKLREKEYEEYLIEEKKEEEKIVDQIVTYKTSIQQ